MLIETLCNAYIYIRQFRRQAISGNNVDLFQIRPLYIKAFYAYGSVS